ncbi:DUF190 domain-containing protein [Ancylobacter dichloromethanicus]
MKQPVQATLLRIFTDETARGDEQPLFEEIVRKAQDAHLAGATVLRGATWVRTVRRSSHRKKILRLSYDLPVVIEIIDSDEKNTRIPSATCFIRRLRGHVGGRSDVPSRSR